MRNRSIGLLVAVIALVAATVAIPGPTAEAVPATGTHLWNFGSFKWNEDGIENPVIAYKLDNVISPGLGREGVLKSFDGGVPGIIPRLPRTTNNLKFALAFPEAVPDVSSCEPDPAPLGVCEQVNFEVEDPDDELSPNSLGFYMKAEVRLTSNEVGDAGLNVVQRGVFNDDDGQFKLQVDDGRPACRWFDGTLHEVPNEQGGTDLVPHPDHALLLKANLNISNGDREGKWHEVICRKTGTGLGARYKITVVGNNKTVEKVCHKNVDPAAGNSDECDFFPDSMGDITPKGALFFGGVTLQYDSDCEDSPGAPCARYVNDQFTGDMGLVEIKIGIS